MEDSHQKVITCFWEIMWTEESSRLKPSACYWHTRSNTLRTSFFSEATMNVLVSTESMDSMMNVSMT